MVVWRCERVSALVPDDESFRAAYAALPEWRRRKADALRREADRRRSVAVWLLLRRTLSGLGVDADTLPVAENACGKPAFVPSVGLHFSLSHAGDRVMAAVSDAEVGCDVERVAPVGNGMLDAALTAAERTGLLRLQGSSRDQEFFRLWVRKESYVKAVGLGMSIEPSSFSASGAPPAPDWTWLDLSFDDGYLGCVCHDRGEIT